MLLIQSPIIETCKAHQVDVFAWLKHALTHMRHADTLEKMEALLPFNVTPEELDYTRTHLSWKG